LRGLQPTGDPEKPFPGPCRSSPMAITYSPAPDVKALLEEVVRALRLCHVDTGRVYCIRSRGSRARGTVARVHPLPRVWQKALGIEPCYVVEVISEGYDRLSPEERERTVIHEALHIPKAFGGGLRPHKGWVSERTVRKLHGLFKGWREADRRPSTPTP